MALTLLIEGRPLRVRDASCLTRRAGTARPEAGFHMGDALRDALLETAAELRGITRPSGDPAEVPRIRLRLTSPLQLMERHGHIRPIQVQAGQEIGRVYEASMGGGPRLAQSQYGEVVQGMVLPDLPPGLQPAHAERYRPWAAWAVRQRASRRSRATLFDVTVFVCCQGFGASQAAERLGLHRASIVEALRRSLWQYCLIAGWETEEAA